MQKEIYSTGQVCALLGIKRHSLNYAFETHKIREPRMRFLNKRVFERSELADLACHYGIELDGLVSNASTGGR